MGNKRRSGTAPKEKPPPPFEIKGGEGKTGDRDEAGKGGSYEFTPCLQVS